MLRLTNLETEKINEKLWRLDKPLIFDTYLGMVSVPVNFITDGASCPKILWSLCSPMSGPQVEAAILHDYLYSKDSDKAVQITRKKADKMFLRSMLEDGTPKWRAHIIYMGVRIGGSKSFKAGHSADKLKGEQYGR